MNYTQRLKLAHGKAMECALALENRLNIHVYCRVDYDYRNITYIFSFLTITGGLPHLVEYAASVVQLKNDAFVNSMGQFVESELLEAFGLHKTSGKPVVTLNDLLGFVGKRGE